MIRKRHVGVVFTLRITERSTGLPHDALPLRPHDVHGHRRRERVVEHVVALNLPPEHAHFSTVDFDTVRCPDGIVATWVRYGLL